jgi:hypothetical protein
MKTLNDALREEFEQILKKDEFSKVIKSDSLDTNLIKNAFEVLLKNKADSGSIDKSRSEFENFLINHFKTKSW